MKKLPAPATPVKVIGAPIVGAEQAEPFVQRWLDMQRGRLIAKLSVCESPIETIFALALLGARDGSGLVFGLSESLVTCPAHSIAVSVKGGVVLSAQHEIELGRKRVRVDFTLCSTDKSIVIEIDGHDFHASKAQRSADAARDLELTRRGWTPVRFTGSDIWRDADGCAAKALDLVGFKVDRGEGLRPAPKAAPTPNEQATMEAAINGARAALDAVMAPQAGLVKRPRIPPAGVKR